MKKFRIQVFLEDGSTFIVYFLSLIGTNGGLSSLIFLTSDTASAVFSALTGLDLVLDDELI